MFGMPFYLRFLCIYSVKQERNDNVLKTRRTYNGKSFILYLHSKAYDASPVTEYSRSAYDSAFVFPREVFFEIVAIIVSETPHNRLYLVARLVFLCVQGRR